MKKDDVVRARRLLTEYIRKIAGEQTELVKDPETGDRMATKAEALARLIWKKALGYKDQVLIAGIPTEKEFYPDKDMISLLYDRLEGKVGIGEDIEKGQQLPKRISELTKQKLNKLANNAGSNNNS